MSAKASRNANRLERHKRVRKKVFGTPERPRMCVFRSLNNISVQIIDDTKGHTLVAASSLDKDVKEKVPYGGNKDAAKIVGEVIAQRALAKGIETVSFDRGGFLYHGRVQELAEGAREAGLKF